MTDNSLFPFFDAPKTESISKRMHPRLAREFCEAIQYETGITLTLEQFEKLVETCSSARALWTDLNKFKVDDENVYNLLNMLSSNLMNLEFPIPDEQRASPEENSRFLNRLQKAAINEGFTVGRIKRKN